MRWHFGVRRQYEQQSYEQVEYFYLQIKADVFISEKDLSEMSATTNKELTYELSCWF